MKKHILYAAVFATSALAFTGIAQAGGTIDNNTDGVAQYKELKERYSEPVKETPRYKRMVSDDEIGNPAYKTVGRNMNDIEPAAGERRRLRHENNHRYND